MTPVLPVPIMLPDFFLQTASNVCSVLVVSFTALLYLAMTLISFLSESDTKPSKRESSQVTFDQGEENENSLRIKSLYLVKSAVLLALFFGFGLSGLPLHADTGGARVVKYSQHEIVPVHAKLRFSTLIVLPENEEILDFTTGDKEFWIINGAHNLCYIHPAQAGIRSNLNLITASGHVYSFLLTEISNEPNVEPGPENLHRAEGAIRHRHGRFRAELRARERSGCLPAGNSDRSRSSQRPGSGCPGQRQQQIEKFRSEYATKLQFDYELTERRREPFLVSAIFHDDRFTYIKCAASEKPAIYEIKDGKPNLINFDLVNGVYIVPKIMDTGYLAIGKKKVTFTRHQQKPRLRTTFRPTRGKHDRTNQLARRSANSRQGTETARPHAQECSGMGHARPRRADGYHHVAHGREEGPDRRDIEQPGFQTPAPLEVNEGRSQRFRAGFRTFSASSRPRSTSRTNSSEHSSLTPKRPRPLKSPTRAAPPDAATDPVQDERKKRAYVSLFSSNVALSYRKELAPPESAPNAASPNDKSFGLQSLPAQGPTSTNNRSDPPGIASRNATNSAGTARRQLTHARREQPQPKKRRSGLPKAFEGHLTIHLRSTLPMERTTSSLKERSSKLCS